MATIDLIVLGMLKKESLSAYDIQKLVEYRNISRWVRISTPSIYKKVIQLEQKGLVSGIVKKEGKMPEKVIYSLTPAGEREFDRLMLEISEKPVQLFLDFNAVIVNLEHTPPEQQQIYLEQIQEQVNLLRSYIEDNLSRKIDIPGIPATGLAVLRQQLILAESIGAWIGELKSSMGSNTPDQV